VCFAMSASIGRSVSHESCGGRVLGDYWLDVYILCASYLGGADQYLPWFMACRFLMGVSYLSDCGRGKCYHCRFAALSIGLVRNMGSSTAATRDVTVRLKHGN
jgi:hypothetical protein